MTIDRDAGNEGQTESKKRWWWSVVGCREGKETTQRRNGEIRKKRKERQRERETTTK